MKNGIELVVFDWAGTTTDFGSQAPVQVFDRTFAQYGMHFSKEEINAPMGMEKKAHIRQMLSSESAGERWIAEHKMPWCEDDVEKIYQSFESNLRQVVAEYSLVIPGVAEAVRSAQLWNKNRFHYRIYFRYYAVCSSGSKSWRL